MKQAPKMLASKLIQYVTDWNHIQIGSTKVDITVYKRKDRKILKSVVLGLEAGLQ